MQMKTPQRVLAIVGGAFLLGSGQAVISKPITLGPANLTTGSGNTKGDPNRTKLPTQPPVAPVVEPDPVDETPPANPSILYDQPTASYAGGADSLLDKAVPDGTLTLRESHEVWEDGAYFLDARHEHEFDAGHIQYAAYLEASLFDTDSDRAFAVADSIPKDATIVIYCVGGECDASKNTAALLEQLGYTDLRIMGAGYDDWVAAGFETETTDGMEVSP
tara:strand:- start:2537 stop:3193 length:657 start_codon:yes stop_codon:yes gene_type:complete